MRTLLRRPPAVIAALLLAITVAGCTGDAPPSGSPPGGAPTALADTSWIVVSVAERAPVPGAVPTITFTADTVIGTGGCNHLGGRYQFEASSRRIAVRELGMTAMGCLQAGVGAFETAFVQALGSATQAGLDGNGQLLLSGPAGQIVLVHLEHPAQSG